MKTQFRIPRATKFCVSNAGLAALVFLTSICAASSCYSRQVECVVLSAANWDEFAPLGKEVDAIYGDIVLRNEKIIAVIAQPSSKRNANMTVRDVGGSIIDLTSRSEPNDQLSCFYPGGNQLVFHDADSVRFTTIRETDGVVKSRQVAVDGKTVAGALPAMVIYRLNSGDTFLTVSTSISNESESRMAFNFPDSVRADRTFQSRVSQDNRLVAFYDPSFHQAYGIFGVGELPVIEFPKPKNDRNKDWYYRSTAGEPQEIATGDSLQWERYIFPAKDDLELDVIADQLRVAEGNRIERVPMELFVRDKTGPVEDAAVTIRQNGKSIGFSRTDHTGKLIASLEPLEFEIVVDSDGREKLGAIFQFDKSRMTTIELTSLGVIEAQITDGKGNPIACKVAFHGLDGTADPDFGPDSRAIAVQNLRYSANGEFKQSLGPGKYDVIVSHGPEFDAVVQQLEVTAGLVTKLNVTLNRTVDTTGWVSTEFHSHSSPSGDNTSDQLGRVLNLLAEQFDFAPCTEHNRIDSYRPHLEKLNAQHRMATCPGMELTGTPLPINHQNAFPMIMRPRTQDGGGPTTAVDPVVQVERLKLWDNGSEKLVQMNHPNLVAILGDRDSNGEADEGFGRMFGYVDVVEVHPLSAIFEEVTELPQPGKRGNVIFNWMQMLNLGYRVPGVINADAHYNFHGSGYRRNFVQCSTDDPASIDPLEIVRNSAAGRVLMSNGPFVTVQAHGKGPKEEDVTGQIGDRIVAKKDSLKLDVKVQCPNWFDINRVQVAVNGRLKKELNFTRRETSQMFADGVVKFQQTIDVPLLEDSHLIVIVAGEGLQLGRVMGPEHGLTMPIAVTNPIYVDIDNDGFQPNRDLLGAPILMPQK